ncbi:hypothetical protein GH714_009802 [Hevea brasiliensis]|uniref:Uncharacterized protein n=1 Tax=Hevea brasiliensis TaxID=3981 RepID=A0A6A6NAD0_HEVBR|nr:hypothetical protein GH714_009802 [Hevea brasiliensis]
MADTSPVLVDSVFSKRFIFLACTWDENQEASGYPAALMEVFDTSGTNSRTPLGADSSSTGNASSERHSGTHEEVPAAFTLAPMTYSTLSSFAILGKRALSLADIIDPFQNLNFAFLTQFISRSNAHLTAKPSDTTVTATKN